MAVSTKTAMLCVFHDTCRSEACDEGQGEGMGVIVKCLSYVGSGVISPNDRL